MPQIIIQRPPRRSATKSEESDAVVIVIEPYSVTVYTDDDAQKKLDEQKND